MKKIYNIMMLNIRIASLLAAFIIATTTLTAHAAEETVQLDLIEIEDGIYIPSTFDVKNAEGKYYTLGRIDASLWDSEYKQERIELTLDNGYTLVKEWYTDPDNEACGYPNISIYNDEREICHIGKYDNELEFYLGDSEDNYIFEGYTDIEPADLEKGIFNITDRETPGYRVTHDGENNSNCYYEADAALADNLKLCAENYKDEDIMGENGWHSITEEEAEQLKKEYLESCGGQYFPGINREWTDTTRYVGQTVLYDHLEAAKLMFDTVDLEGALFDDFTYTLRDPDDLSDEDWHILDANCYPRGDGYICPDYALAMAGQPLESIVVISEDAAGNQKETVFQFTESHMNLLRKDGLVLTRKYTRSDGSEGEQEYISYEVIDTRCPNYFLDEELASCNVEVAHSAKAQELYERQQLIEQAREAAIIRGSERKITETKEEGAADETATQTYTAAGHEVIRQPIVGDVVPINGLIPTVCETDAEDVEKPSCRVTLRDDLGNIVAVGYLFNDGYLDYEYVYFTSLSFMGDGDLIFMMAGTNEKIGGNLNTIDNGTIDTENGETSIITYYEYQ